MRILIVSHMYPSRVHPNHGRFIFNHVKALVDLGADVHVLQPVPWAPRVLAPWAKWREYRQIATEPSLEQVDTTRFAYPQPPEGGLHPFGALAMVPALVRAMRRTRRSFDFQLVHAHSVTPDGCAAVIAGRILGKPVVVSARGSDVNAYPRRSSIALRMARLSIARCDRLVAVSEALACEARTIAERDRRTKVIYNGVDADRFAPAADKQAARAVLGLPAGSTLLLCVGALIREKGILELAEALESMARSVPWLGLVAVGDGPLRRNLEAMQGRLANGCQVILPGIVPSEKVAEYMRGADVLVHPSHAEGLPNVVLEAMASGLPIVASMVGGIPEVVEHEKTGLLVTPGDAKALSSALTRVVENLGWARELGKAGRGVVLARHTWGRNAREHERIYREVLGEVVGEPRGPMAEEHKWGAP